LTAVNKEASMELQIQDLVSSIRKEGIDAAQAEAAAIIEEAKKKAESIVAQANAEAKSKKEATEREIGILKEGALASAEQAKRDAVLSFKEEIQEEFKKILSADIKKTLTADTLVKLIQAAVKGEDLSALRVEVAEVTDALKAKLAKEIKEGLEIKPTKNVQAGFRLAAKDGSGYFDCSDDEIMQMLMPYFRNLNF
jgi:V/A-type H+-transporting ATPase subunit E